MSGLLAKSPHGDEDKTLLQHTLDVMNAAEWLFGTADELTRLGKAWLRFFKIAEDRFPIFHVNLLAAAGFHDWGKANSGFQKAVRRQGEQIIWHEHLSGLLLALEPVTAWLKERQGLDAEIVLSAVLTHHLRINVKEFAAYWGSGTRLQLLSDHPDFLPLLREVALRVGLSKETPELPCPVFWGFKDSRGALPRGVFDLAGHRDKVAHRLRRFEVALREEDEAADARRRMLWAVRAGLIVADAVGSGLPRVGKDMKPWIEETLESPSPCDESFVQNEIIQKRVEEITRQGNAFEWIEFQLQCEALPARALLLAPCGSGKTLAAWRWIAAQVRERSAAHLLFLYPTRATAKEGFRDYVSWAPEAALMHATSAFDLEGMFANPSDPRDKNHYEVERRLFSLGFWGRRAFSATVDQFLAFLQYGYGPVCMLPVLADSVVVIDEVHSFDRNMFSALKEFLKRFDVPVLCMTATLPNDRRDELVNECGLTLYTDKPGKLKVTSEAPRYRLRQTTEGEARERIRAALAEGRRVLWVVNQVKRAQQAALRLACDFEGREGQAALQVAPGVPLLCYHSRFKLADRVKRHDAVVRAFRKGQPAALAITTQVCEMSLDMDADLLVTEACPVTSLIQRMGRCNREQDPRPLARSGEVLVYHRDDLLPYDVAALTGLQEFLTAASGREWLHQADLEKLLGTVPSPPAVGDQACSFTASGPYAMGGEEDFRDSEDFNVQAVVRSDVPAFLGAERKAQPGWTLPAPRWLVPRPTRAERPPKWPSYLGIAPDGHYHQALGLFDRSLAEMGRTN